MLERAGAWECRGQEGVGVTFSVMTSRTTLHLHQAAESNSFGIQPFSKVGRNDRAGQPPAPGRCSARPSSPPVGGDVGVLGCWVTREVHGGWERVLGCEEGSAQPPPAPLRQPRGSRGAAGTRAAASWCPDTPVHPRGQSLLLRGQQPLLFPCGSSSWGASASFGEPRMQFLGAKSIAFDFQHWLLISLSRLQRCGGCL